MSNAKPILEDSRSISFPVMRVKQPIGEFFIGSIKAQDLFDIAQFDIRHLSQTEGIDTYLGIQRQLNDSRVKEISEYTRSVDATFPTSVVLSVQDQCAELLTFDGKDLPEDEEERKKVLDAGAFQLRLSNFHDSENASNSVLYREIARVIDGQHRIAGLKGYQGDDFYVNVSIFIGADISDQAMIFSIVNLAQTKVNKSLVFDLFELSKSRSPEWLCHKVAVALDNHEKSPFYKKIKRLGTATEGRYGETLSQATVVAGLLGHICRDRIQLIRDRDIGRRGQSWSPVEPEDAQRLILRKFFVDEQDTELVRLIRNYFAAVQQKWPKSWASGGTGQILNKTNGFNALIRFLRPAYLYFASPGQMVTQEQFFELFDKVEIDDLAFTRDIYLPGSTGASSLYRDFMEKSGLAKTD